MHGGFTFFPVIPQEIAPLQWNLRKWWCMSRNLRKQRWYVSDADQSIICQINTSEPTFSTSNERVDHFPSGDFVISIQPLNKKMRRFPPTDLIESNFTNISREKQVHTDLVAITKPDDAREMLCVAPKFEMNENLLLGENRPTQKGWD